ncbi:MAG: hypothetical protein Q9169_002257 [Polycauliona sp. 2 TL-2023]
MKTRISKSGKSTPATSVKGSSDLVLEQDHVRLLLLPQSAGSDSRICTLIHPATSKASQYHWCPRGGLYEFQKIAAPKTACRSWLLGPKTSDSSDRTAATTPNEYDGRSRNQLNGEKFNETDQHCASSEVETPGKAPCATPFGHSVKEADISIATSVDVLFFALPSLQTQILKNEKGRFLSMDDLFETAVESSSHLKYLLEQEPLHHKMETRIAAVCDSVDAGDEKMYRLNMDKLCLEVVAKARRMSFNGLPASMEARFVNKVLEMPMINFKREASSISTAATDVVSDTDSPSTSTGESLASIDTSVSNGSDGSNQTNMTVPDQSPPHTTSDSVKNLLRLRTALSFISSSYLSTSVACKIQSIIDSPSSPIDFKPLDEHLGYLEKLRAEALASRSLFNMSRKRTMIDDDEAIEAKAEKRRKKEEEEKRQKTGLTRGIKELKKVDVTGMKKMSDFFGKKPGQGR